MSALLDELYLTWLYSQTGSVKTRSTERTYWHLLRLLFTKEFVWFVPNDDNRAEDGKDLRNEFLLDHNIDDVDELWMREPCSFLEMLVGLSRRLAYIAYAEDARDWFWHLVDNMDLSRFTDAYSDRYAPGTFDDAVDEIVERVIFRTYYFNGHGGLFPLRNAVQDQRKVEIWYQLNTYLIELDL